MSYYNMCVCVCAPVTHANAASIPNYTRVHTNLRHTCVSRKKCAPDGEWRRADIHTHAYCWSKSRIRRRK